MADVMEEYQSSLEDLTFNSKPHINMLTILADENKSHAESIVHLVEAQIAKASVKLPLLYLLDSIIKNVGENYKPLFAKNLVSTFKTSFQSSDDKSKMSMYKLRTTWDAYFPLKKLYALDISIKELDSNWPVKSLPAHLQDNAATNIHVNPKFIKQSSKASQPSAPAVKNTSIVKAAPSTGQHSDAEVDKIRQQLVRQQKELLDLQQKKLILELEQTKQQLAAKQKEVQQTATKKQEKVLKDVKKPIPISSAAGLRVTLSNVKSTAASASGQVSTTPKDPRLKASADSKDKTIGVTVNTGAKKKASKASTKKEKSSPVKSKAGATTTASPKSTLDKKASVIKKKAAAAQNASTEGRKKKRITTGKSPPSASPPPAKVARTVAVSPEQRKRSKAVTEKSPQRKNERVEKLKEQKRDRSLERSMSPRFSPESDSGDQRSAHEVVSPPVSRHRREDALRRRPSFDPDLHIPKELTLSHQNEILKQADHQLRTGQLTHRQHQELLKQLHQLFEMQRMKKLHGTDQRHEKETPMDPRTQQRERLRHEDLRQRENESVEHFYRGKKRSPESSKRPPSKRPPDYDSRRRPTGSYDRPDPNRDRRPPRHPLSDPRQPPEKIRKPIPRYPLSQPATEAPSLNHEPHAQDPIPDRRVPKKRPLLPLPPINSQKRKGPLLANPPRGPQPRRAGPLLPTPLQKGPKPRGLEPGSLRPHFVPVGDYTVYDNERPLSPPPKPPLSPPPFFHQAQEQTVMNLDNQEQFAPEDKKSNLRQYAVRKSSQPKELQKPSRQKHPEMKEEFDDDSKQLDEKKGPEEPEEYIIANMPKDTQEESKELEEPEDYIIAGMAAAAEEEKNSCEEPEDFIIARMPPGAEAYHNHSIGLRRNSDSEKAYVDHIKKIKQSMYTKELHERKHSASESTSAAEESGSEKHSTTPSESEREGIKSPSLPLKKRRYVSADEEKAKEKKEMPSIEEESGKLTQEVTESEVDQDEKEKMKTEKDSSQSEASSRPSENEDISNKDKTTSEEKETSADKQEIVPAAKKGKIEAEKKAGKNEKPSSKAEKSKALTAKEKDLKLRKAMEKRLGKEEVEKIFAKSTDDIETSRKPSKSKKDLKSDKRIPKSKDDSVLIKKFTRSKDDFETKKKFETNKKFPRSRTDTDLGKKFPKSKDDSIVYVIEDQDTNMEFPPQNIKDPRIARKNIMRPFPARPEERRRGPLNFHQQKEEARLQQLMKEEQEKLAWEENLTRELEMEQWKEDRLRHDQMRPGRGRARFMPPGRWESAPRGMRNPGNFDIARGKIFHRDPDHPRLRPSMPGEPPPGHRPPFPRNMNDMRIRHPALDDPRRPPSPGRVRPPGPGWDSRRPRTPPGLRMSHPPFHDAPDDRRLEWELHASRMPPRDPQFHPNEMRRSPPVEFHRVPAEPPPAPTFNQVNVDKLLTDLLTMGIIPGNKKPEVKSQSPVPTSSQPEETKPVSPVVVETPVPSEDKQEEAPRSVSPFIEKEDLMVLDPDAELPEINLSSDLKVRHDEIIKRIYTGIQCSACGLRFTTRQTDLYADHLDWHYRLNRKDKEGGASTHRELYPSAGDWICYEEIENPEDRAKSTFFDETELDTVNKTEIDFTVPLTGNTGEDSCKVCKEAFETFYNENDDEWQFANCIKVDGFNFHPNCYSDRNNIPPTPLLSPTDGIPGLDTLKEESPSEPEPMEIPVTSSTDNVAIKTEPVDSNAINPNSTATSTVDSLHETIAIKTEPIAETLPVEIEIKQEIEEQTVEPTVDSFPANTPAVEETLGEPDNEPAVEATAEQTENSTVTAVTSQSLVETEAKEKSSESKEECSESAADLESKGIAPSEETEPKPNPASLPPTATVTKDETSFSTYDPPADTIAESEAKDDEKL